MPRDLPPVEASARWWRDVLALTWQILLQGGTFCSAEFDGETGRV